MYHIKWPVPKGPEDPHPERLIAVASRASMGSATTGVAATRPIDETSATRVEKRIFDVAQSSEVLWIVGMSCLKTPSDIPSFIP